jgi:hypothetical protein
VSRIIDVPAQFDEQGFDQLAQSIGAWPPSDRLFFDARGVQWAAPYALIGLLTAAQAIIEAGGGEAAAGGARSRRRAELLGPDRLLPACRRAVRVPRQAAQGPRRPAGRHAAGDHAGARHRGRAPGGGTDPGGGSRILAGELGLEAKATMGFAMALSEACQNIVEHAGTGGWVAVQAYNYRRRLGRRVA